MKKSKLVPMTPIGGQIKIGSSVWMNEITFTRKIIPFVFLVDPTLSAKKYCFFKQIVQRFADKVSENDCWDAEVRILVFRIPVRLVNSSGLVPTGDYYEHMLLDAGNRIDTEQLMEELKNKLLRSSLLVSETGLCLPYIYLLADGRSMFNQPETITKACSKNKWLKLSKKRVISVGEPDKESKEYFKTFASSINNVWVCDEILSDTLCESITDAFLGELEYNVSSGYKEDEPYFLKFLGREDMLVSVDPVQIDVENLSIDTSFVEDWDEDNWD